MAIIKCRECNGDVSDEAPVCPNCGVVEPDFARFKKTQRAEKIKAGLKGLWGWAIILFLVWAIASGEGLKAIQTFSSEFLGACTINNVKIEPKTFITNGEFDFGVSVATVVEKERSDGDVTITVLLSSSEGNFEKKRTVFIEKDQTRSVELLFPELTVNATDVSSKVTCSN